MNFKKMKIKIAQKQNRVTSSFIISVVFILASFNNLVIGQGSNSSMRIFYSKIDYDVARTNASFKDDGSFEPAKTLVVLDIGDHTKEFLLDIEVSQWLELLNNDSTSWNANIILCAIHKKDALIYYNQEIDVAEWLQSERRQNAIKYWRSFLEY